ncbi:prolyl 3-hydroxylase 2 isoform X2 [Corythoichthys intestinalis]|uniref:prolyl 3-hydroxylase 2 isoform X2 n=1 Tax=Corythoichthys intestinalis TaxID=161448 RepID=UPI0025A50190|nr:prolyl 3-hydroxylase 2 isoform X2 [Corythoichthys intestinalis]XP_061791117.1 prolyl 3-hydroxylase 2-like [Nerophis lumbriciformis]
MDANFLVVLSAVLLTSIPPSSCSLEPYDMLYDEAVRAFYSGDYSGVVRTMEEALSSYAGVRRSRVRCRLRCQDQHPFGAAVSELGFFDVVLRRAACMDGCIEQDIGVQSRHKISEDVVQDFNRRIPYNYLQLAYLKLKQPDKAAAAAHTYFQANPEHVEMSQNLEQYKDRQGVKEHHFVDREARPHQRSFSAAVNLYEQGDYVEASVLFEEALVEYYKADVECRALCQGPHRFEGHDHLRYRYSLYEVISDHFTQVLHCEHECVRDLATRPGRLSPMENYLPLHYDYLQYAYFQVERVEEALQCALTYLLFHEGDEFMTENVDFYQEMLGHDSEPREEAARYLRRHKQELELLLIGSQTMGVDFTEGNYWSSSGGRDDSTRIPSGTDGGLEYVPLTEKKNVNVAASQPLKEGGPLLHNNVRLVYNSAELNGTQRVLLDHVISEDECVDLQQLAHMVTLAGDGYNGRTSPHTPNEKFEGATVLKALQYGYEGRVPMKSARLFYDASERVRSVVESYFLLNSTLHFSYTHLVCRTAITGQQDHRNDLSHPIHADNCLLDPEANECWKEPPAYTQRDYSALLYLNGDFEGGEFIFTQMDAKTVTATVKPKCGRVVAFSSGGENPHGVKAVTNGRRCAVALWFTLDPLFREMERLQADEVIQTLITQSGLGHGLDINPKDEL